MVTRRNFTRAAGAAALAVVVPRLAAEAAVMQPKTPLAETLPPDSAPLQPITIIVPFARNGTTDQVARLIAGPLALALGVPVDVKNITGDWGATGAVAAAHAKADGHTLIMGQTGTHVVNARAGKPALYDPVADFSPVGLVSISPITFVARISLPVQTLAELKALVTADPTAVAIAHGGFGTPSHIGAVKLKAALGAAGMVEKTYASTMAVLEDIANGRADMMATSLTQALPFIKAGKVKALGLAGTSRNTALPDVYTGTQQGFAELRASHWNGLFAPKGLRPAERGWLATGLSKALDNPVTQRKMRELGIHVPFVEQQGPQALATLQQREIAEMTASV